MQSKKKIQIALSANTGRFYGDSKFGVNGRKIGLELYEYGLQGLHGVSFSAFYVPFNPEFL